jgi:hypothetical protein
VARSATSALGLECHARLIAELIHPEPCHLAPPALAEGEGQQQSCEIAVIGWS